MYLQYFFIFRLKQNTMWNKHDERQVFNMPHVYIPNTKILPLSIESLLMKSWNICAQKHKWKDKKINRVPNFPQILFGNTISPNVNFQKHHHLVRILITFDPKPPPTCERVNAGLVYHYQPVRALTLVSSIFMAFL